MHLRIKEWNIVGLLTAYYKVFIKFFVTINWTWENSTEIGARHKQNISKWFMMIKIKKLNYVVNFIIDILPSSNHLLKKFPWLFSSQISLFICFQYFCEFHFTSFCDGFFSSGIINISTRGITYCLLWSFSLLYVSVFHFLATMQIIQENRLLYKRATTTHGQNLGKIFLRT